MDCKYIKQNDIHEKYILDRLSEKEKTDYLAHLKTCQDCQKKLDDERELIGSIRHFGKSEMKSEIAKQVQELKAKDSDLSWDMILKVAAIFFFLVITPAMIFYYQSIDSPNINETAKLEATARQEQPITEPEQVKAEAKQEQIEERKAESRKKEIADKKTLTNLLQSSGTSAAKGAGSSAEIDNLLGGGVSSSEDLTTRKVLAPKEESISPLKSRSSAPPATPVPMDKSKDMKFDEELESPKRAKVGSAKKNTAPTSSKQKEKMPSALYSVDGVDLEDYPASVEPQTGQTFTGKPNLLYLSKNDYSLSISLIPDLDNSDFYFQEDFPDSFQVVIVSQSKENILLNCYINQKIYNYNQQDISIEFTDEQLLRLKFEDKNSYSIDLKSDSTSAKLIP